MDASAQKALVIGTLGAMLFAGLSSKRKPKPKAPARPPVSPSASVSNPYNYAKDKLPMLQARALGELGTSLAKLAPKAWPGVPLEAWVGFTSISEGNDEDTVTRTNTQQFHELGYFQVPAGPRAGPAPNPDPNAWMNSWGKLAGSPWVKNVLGRTATMNPRLWQDATDDQVAVGLGNLRAALRSVNALIPADVQPKHESSTWAVALAFTGFSAGPAKAARWVNLYAEKLAAQYEDVRWSVWAWLIDADIQAGYTSDWVKGRHANPGASYLRTWEKLECAHQLAIQLGHKTEFEAWYDAPSVSASVMMKGSWNTW